MVGRLLEENKKKSKISVNCFLALGAALGYSMTTCEQENDYGVDIDLRNLIERNGHTRDMGTVLQFQLKATSNYEINGDEILYKIENKTLNDIISRNIEQTMPLIVILMLLPMESDIDWVTVNESNITFRKNLFWYHTTETTHHTENSKTKISIHKSKLLTKESLVDIVEQYAVKRV